MNSSVNNITGLSSTPQKRSNNHRNNTNTNSNSSFREQYQEYILLSQKSSVLQDEYFHTKDTNNIKSINNKIKLNNIKNLLYELECSCSIPIEQMSHVVNSVKDGKAIDMNSNSMNTISNDVVNTVRKGYTTDWLNMKILEQKRSEYNEYQLPIESILDPILIKAINQHENIMENFKSSRVHIGTNNTNNTNNTPEKNNNNNNNNNNKLYDGVGHRNWSKIPLFHELDSYPVIDLHQSNGSGSTTATASGSNVNNNNNNTITSTALSDLEQSIRWVTYLKHRSEIEASNAILLTTTNTTNTNPRTAAEVECDSLDQPNDNDNKELSPSQQAIMDALGDVDLDVLLRKLQLEYLELHLR